MYYHTGELLTLTAVSYMTQLQPRTEVRGWSDLCDFLFVQAVKLHSLHASCVGPNTDVEAFRETQTSPFIRFGARYG